MHHLQDRVEHGEEKLDELGGGLKFIIFNAKSIISSTEFTILMQNSSVSA